MSLEELGLLNQKMKDLQSEIDALAKTKGKAIVLELFKPLFELGIEFAAWFQYTPYFADGDPCVFSIHADEFGLKWPNLDNDEEWMWNTSTWHVLYHLEKVAPTDPRRIEIEAAGITVEFATSVKIACDVISKILYESEDVLLAAFGDHVSVTVFPDRVEVEGYDHE